MPRKRVDYRARSVTAHGSNSFTRRAVEPLQAGSLPFLRNTETTSSMLEQAAANRPPFVVDGIDASLHRGCLRRDIDGHAVTEALDQILAQKVLHSGSTTMPCWRSDQDI